MGTMDRMCSLQPFLHDDPRGIFEVDAFIETDDLDIGLADHELQLGNVALAEPCLGGFDEFSADAPAPPTGIGSEVIDPAAVAVVADHGGAYDRPRRGGGDQDVRVAAAECAAEVRDGIVPADHESTGAPQR